jgi:putative tricarboxylic transport membrane protein
VFDVGLMLAFGIIGYFMQRNHFPGIPMILALVLGNQLELAFRQSLVLSDGGLSIFIRRPISLIFLIVALTAIAVNLVGYKKTSRQV